MCYFYTDCPITPPLESLPSASTGGQIFEFQVLGETHRVLGAGDLLLSQPSLLVLFPPCSLPFPKMSPGTQEAASQAPNSPPTVRRRSRNRSLLKGLRPPMMQATLLDTTVQGPVGCGQPSEGGSLRWVVAGGGADSRGGGTEIENTRKIRPRHPRGNAIALIGWTRRAKSTY